MKFILGGIITSILEGWNFVPGGIKKILFSLWQDDIAESPGQTVPGKDKADFPVLVVFDPHGELIDAVVVTVGILKGVALWFQRF